MNILLAFRNLFAADRAYESIAAAIRDGIERVIIPSAPTELVSEYKKILNLDWAGLAEQIVRKAAIHYKVRDKTVQIDIAQKIAGDFYTISNMRDVFLRFNPESKPDKFKYYLNKTLFIKTANEFRNYTSNSKSNHTESLGFAVTDIPDVPQQDIEEFIADMKEYFYTHLSQIGGSYKTEAAREIFGLYTQKVDEEGPDYHPSDVWPLWYSLRERKYQSASRTTFHDGLKIVRDILKPFFVERNMNHRAAGKTIAERVAKSEFRRRLAKFILGK